MTRKLLSGVTFTKIHDRINVIWSGYLISMTSLKETEEMMPTL